MQETISRAKAAVDGRRYKRSTSPGEYYRGRSPYAQLLRKGRLGKEWAESRDAFHAWWSAQVRPTCKFVFITASNSRNSRFNSRNAVFLGTVAYALLEERGHRVPFGMPFGTYRPSKRGYRYFIYGGSHSDPFPTGLECQMAWMASRIELLKEQIPFHTGCTRALELINERIALFEEHIKTNTEYRSSTCKRKPRSAQKCRSSTATKPTVS